jgi:hypothetical protein
MGAKFPTSAVLARPPIRSTLPGSALRPTTHERFEAARALDRIGGLIRLPAPDPRAAGIPF